MMAPTLFLAHMTSLQVWDAKTGAELQQLNGHTKCVSSMAFSHDDIYLVSGSYDKSVQVWDVITGANLQLDCPWASLGRPSANFSGPGPGP